MGFGHSGDQPLLLLSRCGPPAGLGVICERLYMYGERLSKVAVGGDPLRIEPSPSSQGESTQGPEPSQYGDLDLNARMWLGAYQKVTLCGQEENQETEGTCTPNLLHTSQSADLVERLLQPTVHSLSQPPQQASMTRRSGSSGLGKLNLLNGRGGPDGCEAHAKHGEARVWEAHRNDE
jgi:hypothetical protein